MKLLTSKPSAMNVTATSALLLSLVTGPAMMTPAHATGIPVLDVANLSQNVITSIEAVAQTLKQIQQYQTQLQQYENMLQNTLAPAAYIWDAATSTMNQLRSAIDTLNYYKTHLGSIDAYLGKFQDTAYYRSSPCFKEGGCTAADWAAIKDNQRLGSEAQKKATDALFKGLDKQQAALEADAVTLQRLQASAQGATGQMQAISYANQLASQQANQLLQIRALLVAEQNAIATRNQVLADREAQQAAAGEQLRQGNYVASPVRNW
ncbi:MAG: P-type conjugative transfer protein TrbJ [Candidatus Accumulibacter sp.]|jgi:P-type conjugative transfer protein TrbJ|nr:P-type conjugative transfer protein TrbJ [Accumulibacter sp.]